MKRLLTILFCLFALSASAQDFDPPGLDALWSSWQPGPYSARKQNNGWYPASPPVRQEYYTSATNATVGAAVMAYTNNNTCNTVTGQLVNPSMRMMNLPKYWARGWTGKGMVIGFIDEGYNTRTEHKSVAGRVRVFAGDTIMSGHTLAAVSAAIGNSLNGAMGAAPDATAYVVDYGNHPAGMVERIAWLRAQGCRIITSEWYTAFDDVTRAAIRDFIADGGIFISAAGNDHTLANITPICNLPGVICVAGSAGGSVMATPDSLYYQNFISAPVFEGAENVRTVFALPYVTVAATYDKDAPWGISGGAANDPRNFYSAKSGTSFDAPQVAGLYACVGGKFWGLPSWCWTWMITHDAHSYTTPPRTKRVVQIINSVATYHDEPVPPITVTIPSLP